MTAPVSPVTNFPDDAALGRRLALTVPTDRIGKPGEDSPPQRLRGGLLPTRLERFEVGKQLGQGGGGTVYAAFDRDLRREVAIKRLDQSDLAQHAVEAFIGEARISASLDHPNVVPVHEIEADGECPGFVMRRVRGRSLGEILNASTPDNRVQPIADTNAVINAMVAVANAVAYAHNRRVIHQDIKPDNIMIGDFGEVLLVDWGSAMRVGDTSATVFGTPLYTSPEQARRERPDERSDIFCLGATLFHALLLRVPLSSKGGAELFWQRKRAGDVDAPNASECAAVAAPLLAIVLKSLAPRREDRYASADELVRDLRAYQAGMAVSAYREAWHERLRRWHRRHARVVWPAAIATVAVIASTALIFRERLERIARWGAPIASEAFADPAWTQRWKIREGEFTAADGTLTSTGPNGSVAIFSPLLTGDVALEFDARLEPGSAPGDISAVWTEASRESGYARGGSEYLFQVGADDDTAAQIYELKRGTRLTMMPFAIEPGRWYHIRAEIDAGQLALSVDGTSVGAVAAGFQIGSGRFGLYAYYPGKSFRNVRVYAKGLPLVIPVIAIGDRAFRRGDYAAAEREYAEVEATHADADIAIEAAYKRGLCRERVGDDAGAEAAWTTLADGRWRDAADVRRIDHAFTRGDVATALSELRRMNASSPGSRSDLRLVWTAHAPRLADEGDDAMVEAALAIWRESFADSPETHTAAATLLVRLRLYDDVLAECTASPSGCCLALMSLGRTHEAMALYPQRQNRAICLIDLCRWDDILRELPNVHWARAIARCQLGLVQPFGGGDPTDQDLVLRLMGGEALSIATHEGNTPNDRAVAWLWLDRPNEAAAVPGVSESPLVTALLLLDRGDEALAFSRGLMQRTEIHQFIALRRHTRGQPIDADVLRAADAMHINWIWPLVVRPFLALPTDADGTAVRRALDAAPSPTTDQPLAWYAWCRFGGGPRTPAPVAPAGASRAALIAIADAISAERAGDSAAAIAAYAAWRALPPGARSITTFIRREPLLEAFVAWRQHTLAGTD